MAKETGKGGPLRDWQVNSYDENGRVCSPYGDKGCPKHEVSLPKAGDTYDASGSGDPGRRNK